jgi:AFG3 family protein
MSNKQKKKYGFLRYQQWVLPLLMCIILATSYFNKPSNIISISENRFEQMLINNEVAEVYLIINKNMVEFKLKPEVYAKNKELADLKEKDSNLQNNVIYTFKIPSPEVFNVNFKAIEQQKPYDTRVGYKVIERYDFMGFLENWGSLIIMIIAFLFLMRRMGGSSGGQLFSIGRSKATLFDAKNTAKIMFKDVAGLKEAKEEIMEIVDFLKNKEKFTKLGGKIPKGVLLVGPPGTGKTLLAKAVAGEAGVPFFSLSGSDFVEMFVGVGAARVRDLFKMASDKAPCIIFIDEIDAVGRARGKGQMPGANDERESTLNSLLVEMDGFSTDSGVIILAATNRPDVLDKALLRPGRFDRQISIDKPDIIDRESIFEVYLAKLKIASDVSAKRLAEQTPGFAGAEIANVCNEAALIGARKERAEIHIDDFNDAIDRVIGGLEKKNKIISPAEKEIVAYHEAGHAVAGWFLEHAHPLVKVSIVPRGVAALGYAQYLPKEQFIYQEDQLIDEMCMALGGRAAEQIIFGKMSTGALNDLERITKMAYSMVCIYGMNLKIGNISFYDAKQGDFSFTKPYSDSTAKIIDEEVKEIVDNAYLKVKDLLTSRMVELRKVALELLKREVIFKKDLIELIGERPFDQRENKDIKEIESLNPNAPRTEN